MNSLGLYTLLGLLEVLLVLGAAAAVLFHRLRRSRAETEALRRHLAEAAPPQDATAAKPASPQPAYADLLRQQIARSDRLLGEMRDAGDGADAAQAAAPGDDPATDALTRQMLVLRQRFLQVELDAQEPDAAGETHAWRTRLVDGLRTLVSELPGPGGSVRDDPSAGRDEETRLREQIAHLRSVIDNQHAVMRELREVLEAHGGDSEALQTAVGKLAAAERAQEELQQRFNAVVREKERLQHASPDAELLHDLVGSQQRTIQNLQQLLAQISPAADKAEALHDALGTIQRTNRELNSCVMVLEDENALLRGRVESLQARLAELEGHASAASPQDAAATDELLKTLFDQPGA